MQSIPSIGKAFSVVLALLLWASGSSAQAASGYRPAFEKGRTVYTDPAAATNPNLPVEFNGLAGDLELAGKKHNVTYYFVFIEETDERFDPNTNFALPVLKQILNKWWDEPGFDKDRHILIVHVRKTGTKFGGKTAVEAGPALKRMGLTGARFDQRNGPVMSAVFDHMRNSTPSHRRFVQAICDNCNDDLSKYVASQQTSATPATPATPSTPRAPRDDESSLGTIIMFMLCAIGVFVGIPAMLYWSSVREDKRTELVRNINARKQKLEAFGIALVEFERTLPHGCRPTEKSSYSGETEAAQSNIAARIADLRTGYELVKFSTQSAGDVVNNWWSLDLTSQKFDGPVRVTSSLDGGSAKYPQGSTHYPQIVLDSLSLDSVKAAEKLLRQRMEEAKGYADAVQAREDLKKDYASADLPFGIMADQDAQLQKPAEALSGALKTDPLKALWEQRETFERIVAFNERMRAGLRTAASLPEIDAGVATANGVATASRKVPLELHYTGKYTGNADATPRTVEVAYHSEENPESHLRAAEAKVAESRELLALGRTVDAEKAAQAATELTALFRTELRALHAARLTVKREVPATEGLADELKSAIDAAHIEVSGAEVDFAHENDAFNLMREELREAALAHAQALLNLQNCAEAFEQQRFNLAKRLVEACPAQIESAQAHIEEALALLQELRKFKAHATELSASTQAIRAQLAAELPKGTTDATRKIVEQANSALQGLGAALEQTPVNWRVAGTHAAALDAGLVNLGQSMASDKKSYEEATKKITRAKQRGCPSSKRSKAQDAADSGNYSSMDGFLVGYLAGSYSSGSSGSSGSGCSTSSGSSCSSSSGSSCGGGGGGCGGGGGGCGGGGCGGS